ncbi:MAG: phage tail protein [Oscillospiraceae bacterium]|nr:phage tail protein [Oscillospiraceae bacterium]
MFDYNIISGIPEPLHMYLCRPDGKILCELNGILKESASIEINLNNQFQLSFDYARYISDDEGSLIESNGYHLLNIGMYIFVEKIGLFRLQHPPFKYDGSVETKSVSAFSAECELENKDLVGFKINTGEDDSLENLVKYEDGESEDLLNPYTNLPYDYILFYDTRADKLENFEYYTDENGERKSKYTDEATTVENAEEVNKIVDLCTFIPRIKSKVITETTTNNEGNEETNTDLVEYVVYKYDETGKNIISVTLNGFKSRVDSLITFYQQYHSQLSLIDLAIEKCNCNWSVGEIDPDLADKKFQFTIDSRNIYSFLTQDIATVSKCLVQFDIINKKINIISAKSIGEDTGIVIARRNLLKSIDVSCDESSLITRFSVSGGNDLTIRDVNFGYDRIDDISYFLNAQDLNGERIYVDDSLAAHYKTYIADREAARKAYIDYSKTYNQRLIDIDELKYRLPNDYLKTDWSQYSKEELENLYKVYQKLLLTLKSLYKEEYPNGLNSDGSINEEEIKRTFYWNDYYTYNLLLIQIEKAIAAINDGTSYDKIDNDEVLKEIYSYKTEWSLYGIVELENKIEGYKNSMKLLSDNKNVILKSDGSPKAWAELSETEQLEYSNSEFNYKYTEYKELYDNCAGAQQYLDKLKTKLSTLEEEQQDAQDKRTEISRLITINNYDRSKLSACGVEIVEDTSFKNFTPEEIRTINLLYIDSNYSNSNILTTSLDTLVTSIDRQSELLADADEQLSISSQPQFKFSCAMDNLLSLIDFKPMADQFKVGNYITMQYFDDYYVRLRLVKMSFNPCLPSSDSLNVEFSNFIKSNVELSDISYILGLNSGSGSSGVSGGSGSGASGTIGNDIDATISDTMLSKLVNTELFGTAVTDAVLDTLDLNALTAKNATFGDLAGAKTTINGAGITTGKISSRDKTVVFDLDNNKITCTSSPEYDESKNKDGMLLNFSTNGLDLKLQKQTVPDETTDGYYDEENGKFYTDESHTAEITNPTSGNYYKDLSTNNIYIYNEDSYEAVKPKIAAEMMTDSGGFKYMSGNNDVLDSEIVVDGTLGTKPTRSEYPTGAVGYFEYLSALVSWAIKPIAPANTALVELLHNKGCGFTTTRTLNEDGLAQSASEGRVPLGTSFLRYDGLYNARAANVSSDSDAGTSTVNMSYGRYNYEGYANALYYCVSDGLKNIKKVHINLLVATAEETDVDLSNLGIDADFSDQNFSLIDGMVIDVFFKNRQSYGSEDIESTESIYLDVCGIGEKEVYNTDNRKGVNAWLDEEIVKFRYSSLSDCWFIVSRSSSEGLCSKGIVLSDEGTDIDSVVFPGVYIIEANKIAETFSNLPVVTNGKAVAGYLEVFALGKTGYILQRFTPYSNAGIFTRWYNQYNSSWGSWMKYSATSVSTYTP